MSISTHGTRRFVRAAMVSGLLGLGAATMLAGAAHAQSDEPSDAPSDCPSDAPSDSSDPAAPSDTPGGTDAGTDGTDTGTDTGTDAGTDGTEPSDVTAQAAIAPVVFGAPAQDPCPTDGGTTGGTTTGGTTTGGTTGSGVLGSGALARTGADAEVLLIGGAGAALAAAALRRVARRA